MPAVHYIGKKWFTQFMRYPTRKFPIVDRGHTQEIEWPFRTGDSWVVRVPATTAAMVVGKWVGSLDEQEALESALSARWVGDHVG